jgi:hypothetical protein
MSPCCLDEWTLVVAELDVGMDVNGGAWSSPVQQRHGPPAILVGAALVLLLQRRCLLDRRCPASSARRGWLGEGHNTNATTGDRARWGRGPTGRTDEWPGNAQPHHDGRMSIAGFFFKRRGWSAAHKTESRIRLDGRP